MYFGLIGLWLEEPGPATGPRPGPPGKENRSAAENGKSSFAGLYLVASGKESGKRLN
jgi:hypothetical protein